MKRLIAFLIASVLLLSLVACKCSDEPESPNTNGDGYSFTAKVVDKYESSLLLEVSDAKSSNISEGSQAIISIKSDYPDCSVGDYVTVVFDGIVLESYPLQIPNVYSITLSSK